MIQRVVVFLVISFPFLFASQGFSQERLTDSSARKELVSNLYHYYFNQIGENARLFNGSEYIRNGQRAIGFPFFESNDMLTGFVSYKTVIYPELSLYYDLVADELIIHNYSRNAFIVLSKEKVDSFSMKGHIFLRLESIKTNGELMGDGYYDRLTADDPGVYVKRFKKLVLPDSGDPKYVQYNTYYLKMKDTFYLVDGRKTLFNLLKDDQDLLKKFIRSNKLSFKKRFEEALVRTTTYYAQLKH